MHFQMPLPYLDFNTSYVTVQRFPEEINCRPQLKFQYILCYGSTAICGYAARLAYIFQYILCYGSTAFLRGGYDANSGFQYILCYGSTCIYHPKILNVEIFQYILCYGSTRLIPLTLRRS